MHLSFFFVGSILPGAEAIASILNAATIEVVKILFVSTAWIGGLTYFMWRRERRKAAFA